MMERSVGHIESIDQGNSIRVRTRTRVTSRGLRIGGSEQSEMVLQTKDLIIR